jgi:uncharacterized protein YcfJ
VVASAGCPAAALLFALVLVAASARPAAADVRDPATDLRVTLNRLSQEHVYLAGAAIGAALGGRSEEFEVAAAATDANSKALAALIGSVYGPQAE